MLFIIFTTLSFSFDESLQVYDIRHLSKFAQYFVLFILLKKMY